MAGLMDSIQQQLNQPAAPNSLPQLGQTQQAQGLLQAKLGKASTGAGTPAQSGIGEQVAQNTTRLGLQQIGNQSDINSQQIGQQQADIQQQGQLQSAQHTEAMSQIQQKYSQNAQAILDNLANNKEQLQTQKGQAQMEQAGFMIRGQNTQYVQQLKQQGQLNRLQNQDEFRYNLAKDVFNDKQDLFKDEATFKTAMNADDRTFQSGLATMSDNFAINAANLAYQQQAAQSRFSGMSGLLSAGIGAGMAGYNQSQANEAKGLQDYNIQQAQAGKAPVTSTQYADMQSRLDEMED